MKKSLLTAMLLAATAATLSAQQTDYEYHPLPMDGKSTYFHLSGITIDGTTYVISEKETLIDGKAYHEVMQIRLCSQRNLFDEVKTKPTGILLREEDKRIYRRYDVYGDVVLYDFNLKVGESIRYEFGRKGEEVTEATVQRIDTIRTNDGLQRRQFTLLATPEHNPEGYILKWIEGIGGVGGDDSYGCHTFDVPYTDISTGGRMETFQSLTQNGKVVYVNLNDLPTDCDNLLTSIAEAKVEDGFRIVKNPTEGSELLLDLGSNRYGLLELYDPEGICRLRQDMTGESGTCHITLPDMGTGTLILILTREDGRRESATILRKNS